ncbi:unnamed protein product [Psylliodes chrysocephalus]|uniref:Leucine-rich repeat-containing protein 51 n=1 Tax=Psylliodes chrysocephalus TaxID=3402493 RepID=A0A9P0D154_9CUCU|nr:unnamed protein product [Psylliodes chrysocephala]
MYPTYTEKPADFSFQNIRSCNADVFLDKVGLDAAKFARVKGIPFRGPKRKYLTKSVWLNNNKLKTFKNIDQLLDTVLEHPEKLEWLDLSFNQIINIDESISKFPNLKMLYLHGNCINEFNEIAKLKLLHNLKHLTFHGNPISNHPRYRGFVVAVLPQLANLDFSAVTKTEKISPLPAEALKYFKEEKRREEEAARAKKK